jgi:hypothetical protein
MARRALRPCRSRASRFGPDRVAPLGVARSVWLCARRAQHGVTDPDDRWNQACPARREGRRCRDGRACRRGPDCRLCLARPATHGSRSLAVGNNGSTRARSRQPCVRGWALVGFGRCRCPYREYQFPYCEYQYPYRLCEQQGNASRRRPAASDNTSKPRNQPRIRHAHALPPWTLLIAFRVDRWLGGLGARCALSAMQVAYAVAVPSCTCGPVGPLCPGSPSLPGSPCLPSVPSLPGNPAAPSLPSAPGLPISPILPA